MSVISVIVPIYKVEKYLKQCIDSIINQSFTDLEIILVDDGSPDNCGAICDEYKEKDKRIKVIHKNNGGLSSARNEGLKIAEGKYIAFVDSDDWIEKTMYEKLYNLIEKYDCDLAQCKFKEFYENEENPTVMIKNKKIDTLVINNIEALNFLYSERYIETVVSWNKLYKRSLFQNVEYPEGRIHEDEFVIHKILYNCKKVILYDEECYYYRKTKNSIMNKNFNIKRLDKLDAIKNRIKFFYDLHLIDLYKKTIVFYKNLIIDYYFLGKNSCIEDKNILIRIKKEYRKIFKVFIDNIKIKLGEKIMSYIFYLNPNIYYYIQKIRRRLVVFKNMIRGVKFMKIIGFINALYGRYKKKKEIILSFRYCKEFKKYKNKKKIIHMLTPIHGNMGDQAIVYATNKFLKENYSDYIVIEIYKKDLFKYAKAIKKILNKDDFIVLIGGGNMNNIWLNEEVDRRFVIKFFSKIRIVSMPQTINFTNDIIGNKEKNKTKKVYNKHKDLTIIAREKTSYKIMKDMFVNSKVLINPDIVLYLNNLYSGNEYERTKIMTCLRHDKESILTDEKDSILTKLNDEFDNLVKFDTVLDKTIKREEREEELKDIFIKFLKCKVVLTDRLHGMIFCAITKTPCIVTKSLDHKIRGTYEWIKDLNYIVFVESLNYEEIKILIDKLSNIQEIKTIDFNLLYFNKLKEKIQDSEDNQVLKIKLKEGVQVSGGKFKNF